MRALAALIVLAAAGCGAVGFDVDEDLPDERVQGSPLGGLLPSFLPSPVPLSIDIKSETQKRSTGPATAAYLKALSFSITPHDHPTANFDFVDEIHISIAAPSNGSLPTVEIAGEKPVPRGATRLDLTVVPKVDLLPYLNAGAQVSATASGRQPSSDVTFDGHITVNVRI